MSIPFTQFLRPDGRRMNVVIDLDQDVEAHAHRLIRAGIRFEIENLGGGLIHMTAGCGAREISTICGNGPEVVRNVESLIYEATNLIREENKNG